MDRYVFKSFLIAFFIISIVSYVYGMGSRVPYVSVKEPEINLPREENSGVSIKLDIKASPVNIARISRIVSVIQKVVSSEKFKSRVVGSYYKGKLQFFDTNLSNEEVFNKIIKGNELGSGNDYEWDLDIAIEKARCSTLGWTYPSTPIFWFNSCGFESRSDSGIGGTICHEYLHKLGFEHSVKWTKDREFSVPYAVGTVCAELYNEFK